MFVAALVGYGQRCECEMELTCATAKVPVSPFIC